MAEWQSGKAVVSRLRVNGSDIDPLAARLHAERLLGSVQLCPPGIPPSAIVCLRKLSDPMPGAISLDQHCLLPPPKWQQAVNDAIEKMLRAAVRPVREFVPANAESVIFNDRAEMLACLAMDWCGGQIAMRWWWRGLLPNLNDARSIVAAWMRAPEYIPAAWQHLAKRGRALEFAARIRADDSRRMLKAIVERFALFELGQVIEAAAQRFDSAVESTVGLKRIDCSVFNSPIIPWQKWAKDADDISLPPERKLLLGIALMLQRAPAVARTEAFAREVQDWVEASGQRVLSPEPAKPKLSDPFNPGLAMPANKPLQNLPEIVPQSLTVKSGNEVLVNAEKPIPIIAEKPDAEPRQFKEPDSDTKQADEMQFREESAGNEFQVLHKGDESARASVVVDASESESSETPLNDYDDVHQLPEQPVYTDYGGLFYLLNLALYLELYGDITTPSVRDIPLGIWDFLALLGEQLVGAQLRRDPVWALLAQLAGRHEQTAPGSDCAMPDEWRLPAAWLQAFDGASEWQWAANDGRLKVWHPAGFLVLDVVLNLEIENQLASELLAYAAYSPQLVNRAYQEKLAHDLDRAGNSLERWLDWFTPYARARLRRAMGADDAGRELCKSRARVFVTATHLDVMFSLADLMVEIRLAGLDRDPGWIPATGRIIRFHFN